VDDQQGFVVGVMIRRNRLYGSPSELVNKAIASFYKQEKSVDSSNVLLI